jgi:hypothetical protein
MEADLLAGFSHRGLALLAATIRLADKESTELRVFEPLVGAADQVTLGRAAAPWLLLHPLRRLGQSCRVDVRLDPQASAA